MYIEGNAAAWVLFWMGFLSCGFLALLVWHGVSALQMKAVLKLLEEYLEQMPD